MLKDDVIQYLRDQDYWTSAFAVIVHLNMLHRPFEVTRCITELYKAGVIESDTDHTLIGDDVRVYGVFYRIKANG